MKKEVVKKYRLKHQLNEAKSVSLTSCYFHVNFHYERRLSSFPILM